MTVLVDNREKPETITEGRKSPHNSFYGYIYKIQNKVNGKVYIGQTTQKPEKRRYHHHGYLKQGRHSNPHLQCAFNKYGEKNFKFSVLNWAISREDLNNQEVYFIQKYNALNSNYGYNLQSGGNSGKASLETRKKMSESMKGEKHPLYGKKGILSPNYGKKRSYEHKQKISESMKGKKHYFYGKKLPNETCKKMSDTQGGKGLFGFSGTRYGKKQNNPWTRVWQSYISYHGHRTYLGYFNDPYSASFVYNMVKEELYG